VDEKLGAAGNLLAKLSLFSGRGKFELAAKL